MKLNYPNADVGQCPKCGNFSIDHDISAAVHDEEGHIVYSYTCSSCEFEGQEVYDVVFCCHRKNPDRYSVQCNQCSWHGSDDDLVLFKDENGYATGCPNCKTDAYLMDVDNANQSQSKTV